MSEAEKPVRVLPMPVVHSVWNDTDGEYPGVVKVSFSNGKVRSYRLEVEQPKPHTFRDPIAELVRRNTYGGGKHLKKSR